MPQPKVGDTSFDRRTGLWNGKPAELDSREGGVQLSRGEGTTILGTVNGQRVKCFTTGYIRVEHETLLESQESKIVQLEARIQELEKK